jgi:hypothetical protein
MSTGQVEPAWIMAMQHGQRRDPTLECRGVVLHTMVQGLQLHADVRLHRGSVSATGLLA